MKTIAYFSFFIISLLPVDVLSQTDYKIQTNGNVHSSLIVNNRLYIGGSFSYAGPYTGSLLTMDPTANTALTSFPVVNGDIQVIIPDNRGGWFVGGSFTKVNGRDKVGLVHILNNGAVDQNWTTNINYFGSVNALIVHGDVLYIGGTFSTVNNTNRNRAAAVDVNSGLLLSWNPNVNSTVNAMAVSASGDVVYIGGTFTTVGGIARRALAAVGSSTGSVLNNFNPVFNLSISNLDVFISSLNFHNNLLYVGGNFDEINGLSRGYLAALKEDGTVENWDPSLNSRVLALDIENGQIYVGGWFTIGNRNNVAGPMKSRNNLAAFDLMSAKLSDWNPHPNGNIFRIDAERDIIYVAGAFSTIGGQTRHKVAAIDANSNSNNALALNVPMSNGSVAYAVCFYNNKVVSGGNFTSYGGETRNNIAAFDLASNTLLSWNPRTNNSVHALAASITGDTIFAGGTFTMAGGQMRERAAALNAQLPAGTALNWNPGFNDSVLSIAVMNETIFLGGRFTQVGAGFLNQTRNRFAAISNQGDVLVWNPNANGTVRTMTIKDNLLYAGGDFTQVDGDTRQYIAAIDVETGRPSSWNPVMNGLVRTIHTQNTLVYAGGDFTSVNHTTRNRICAINISDGAVTDWNPNANHIVNGMFISNNIIYVGGRFSSIGGRSQTGIAALSLTQNTNNSIAAWNADVNASTTAGINTIAGKDNFIYVGGLLNYANGITGDKIQFTAAFPTFNFITLPVELKKFQAQATTKGNLISWAMENERGGMTYSLLRSTDGVHFSTIWKENTNKASTYRYLDQDHNAQVVYYQLKWVTQEGIVHYSGLQRIVQSKPQQVNNIYFNGHSLIIQNPQSAIIMVMDASGKVLLNRQVATGTNTVSMADRNRGLYFYKLVSTESNQSVSGKFFFK